MVEIITQKSEILLIKHSVLNNLSNAYDIPKTVEYLQGFERYANGRKVVPCFEGDLTSVRETGEPVFTHKNFERPSQREFKKLRERKIASSLEETLGKVARFNEENPNQRLVLCLEPKIVTPRETIASAIKKLKEYGIKDAYFDSFYGNKLDEVIEENESQGTSHACSLHLMGNIGNTRFRIPAGKQKDYDLLAVPYIMSFGKMDKPVIYGAVGSVEKLEELAEDSKVLGIYLKLKEGSGIKGAVRMLWNSLSNTKRFRGPEDTR